jgi:tetratricopeptide (TPR) repeat protein
MNNHTDAAERAAKRKLDVIVGLGVVAIAAIVYLFTLSLGVFPGQSASLMATYTGVEPMVAPIHPVWGAIVGAIGKMGSGGAGAALRLNIFSLATAVCCVAMLYLLFSELAYGLFDTQKVPAPVAAKASVIGAAFAAMALAFSVPFWITATRLHFQVFDLFLLLVLAHLLLLYIRTKALVLFLIFSLLLGVSIVEAVPIALFAPLFALYVLRAWLRDDDFKGYRLFLGILFTLAGLSLYFLAANHFFTHEDISLRGYGGYWDVVRQMLKDQAHIFKASIPDIGWLFPVAFVVVPWLATLAIAPRAFNETRDWSFIFFHIALSVVVVVTITNTGISRWGLELARLREGQSAGELAGILPVFLYAMTAMVAGYAVAYWYVIVKNRENILKQLVDLPNVKFSIWSGYVFGWLVAVIVLLAAVINGQEASGKRGDFADACARELLANLKGRPWLVTDGMFDNHLRLEAARIGQPLKLIALQRNDNPIYIRQLKKTIESDPDFPPSERIRLQNSADLGVMAFVQDWIECDSNVIDRIAVMSAPDLLVGAGYVVAPNYFCFIGARNLDSLRDEPVLEKYDEFWKRMRKTLAKSRGRNDPISQYRADVRRQVGFVANNAGVLLEDLGRDEEAYEVYGIVRQIDSDNISALLNRVEMLHRKEKEGFHAADKAVIEKDLREFVGKMKHRLPIWSLSRSFGYVRSPILFAQLGWTWALSGQPGMALAGMRRAADVATTTASRTRVREAMADILLRQNEDAKSESIYADILSEDPDNQRALLSMSRIAARRGSFDKAREWLSKAKTAGADNGAVALESAALDLAANKPENARITLTEITELQPRNLQALGMLAVSVIQMRDFEEVEKRILPKMESVAGTPDDYLIHITRGQLAYAKGKDFHKLARDSFERASTLRPGIPVLQEWILRLDFMLVDKEAAEQHARQLLRIDRDNGFANYIMGSLMLERGRSDVAEDYLRRSVSSANSPEALNDLAELLRKTGNYKEAEERARAAIDLAPDFYVTYDTLGGVLADTKRLSEAEQAYNKALELFDDDLRVHLNLAKLLFRMGNLVKAREIVAKINPRRSELPPAEQEDLARLVRDLTPGRK